MNRRRGILLALLGVMVVVFGGLALVAVLRRSMAPSQAPTPPPPLTASVVVAARALPVRAVLRAQDLALVEVPIELVPQDALSDVEAAAGKITKIPLTAGEMLMRHHLADPTNVTEQDLAFVIGDDQVVMAFPATDLMSQINVLKAGDLVDVLASVEVPILLPGQGGPAGPDGQEEKPEDTLFTFDALQRVEISAVVVEVIQPRTSGAVTTGSRLEVPAAGATPLPTPTPEPAEIVPQAILLALAPQDALVLKHLKDAGGVIDIVLRAPTSTQEFDLDPVMAEYLKDRFGLVIRR